jgi:hypothetical protein
MERTKTYHRLCSSSAVRATNEPRFASAAAFSRLICSNESSHSIVCTRPFFDCKVGCRWEVICANEWSISSSSSSRASGAPESAGSKSDSRCFSKNAAKSTSGTLISSPKKCGRPRISESTTAASLFYYRPQKMSKANAPSESSWGSSSAYRSALDPSWRLENRWRIFSVSSGSMFSGSSPSRTSRFMNSAGRPNE